MIRDLQKIKWECPQRIILTGSVLSVFFNVPNNPAGSANVFVIHCEFLPESSRRTVHSTDRDSRFTDSYFQPEVQAFTLANGAAQNFPTSHGQALPIPLASNDVSPV